MARTQIVVDITRSGFALSEKAIVLFRELKKTSPFIEEFGRNIFRNDPILIQVITKLGTKAFANGCFLRVVTLPIECHSWKILMDRENGEFVRFSTLCPTQPNYDVIIFQRNQPKWSFGDFCLREIIKQK